MKNFKKFLSICIIALVVIATAVTSVIIFGEKDRVGVPTPEKQEQVDWSDYGVYYASAEEETGASAAPEHMKGGSIYIGKNVKFDVNNVTIEYHESYYGGAFYVDDGATLTINNATIRCNGAMFGGAIYVAAGGKLVLNGGTIEYNNAEQGPAIYVEDEGEVVFGDNISDPGAYFAKNEYAKFGEFHINYYVDNQLIAYSEQKIAAFRADEAPLTYEECNGWFWDDALTETVEEGDILRYTKEHNVPGSYYTEVNVYTKRATLDKLDFTKLTTGGYKVIATTATTGDIVIPKMYSGENVTAIGGFKGKSGITSFWVGSGVYNIPDECFYSCTALSSFNFTDKILTIGSYAFYDAGLTKIVLSDSIQTINNHAFRGCTKTTEVVFEGSINCLTSCFEGMTGLNKLVITDINMYASSTFNNQYSTPISYAKNVYLNDTLLKDVVLSCANISQYAFYKAKTIQTVVLNNGVKEIGYYAFSGTSIKSFDFGNTVETIMWNAFSGTSQLMDVIIPSSVKVINNAAFYSSVITNITFNEGLQQIGDDAFSYCENLTSVEIPNTVISLGSSAFRYCTNLANVVIPNSVTTFGSNVFSGSGIVNLSIDMTKIPGWQFYGYSTLRNVTIGKNVTSFGDAPFTTSPIETVYMNAENVPARIFNGFTSIKNIVIGDTVRTIGNSAFSKTDVTSVVIPSTVTTVGEAAFMNCASLTSFEMKNGVTTIGPNACNTCSALKNVVIPDTITSFGGNAFAGCPIEVLYIGSPTIPEHLRQVALKEVTIGKNVTGSITSSTFIGCVNIVKIVVDENNPIYDSRDNCNAIVKTATNTIIQGCSTTVVPSTITGIGDYAFYKMAFSNIDLTNISALGSGAFYGTLITTAVIHKDIEILEYELFNDCKNLSSVTFAEGSNLKKIHAYVFQNCTALKSITLPEGLFGVYSYAFRDCGITEIELPASAQRIGRNCFNTCTSVTFAEGAYSNNIWQVTDGGDVILEQDVDLSNPTENASKMKGDYAMGYYIRDDYEAYIVPPYTINYYVDGELVKSEGILENATFKVKNAPLDYNNCNGYYFEPLYRYPVNDGQDISTAIDVSLGYINVYTQRATLEFLTFRLNEDTDKYSVSATVTSNIDVLSFPMMHENKLVTVISGGDMDNLPKIGSVHFPHSIEKMDGYAITTCGSQGFHLNIPNKVKIISGMAIRIINCGSIKISIMSEDIHISSIGIYIPTLTNIQFNIADFNNEYYAQNNCLIRKKDNENILITAGSGNVPEGVTIIGESVYVGTTINSIVLPSTLKTIEKDAFRNSGIDGEIVIPSTVTKIEPYAFEGIGSTSIIFADPNGWYVSTDSAATSGTNLTLTEASQNAIYLKEIYEMHYWFKNCITEEYIYTLNSDGESYSVAAGDTDLSGEIVIPSTYNGKPVTAIAENGFANCAGITSVTISASIEVIGKGAFVGCSQLTDIYIVFPQIDGYYNFVYLGDSSTISDTTESTQVAEQLKTKTEYAWNRRSFHSGGSG